MKLLELLEKVGKLKSIKRSGWVREGVPEPESVAGHSFRVAFMAMILAKELKKDFDMEKVLKLALLDDVAEAVVGDLVTERGGSENIDLRNNQQEVETKAMYELTKELGCGQEIFSLWKETDERSTEEGKFVKQIDRLEMALQAYEYEKAHGKDFSEFFESTKKRLEDPELIKIFEEIISKRK